jgi:hypothetical protein
MTTAAAVANANDAYLFSGATSYSSALAGPADGVSATDDTTLFVGQQRSGANYTIWQSFVEFGFTATAITGPTTAHIRLYSSSTTGTNVNRGLDVQTYDWGTALNTADWRTPAQLTLAQNKRVASLDQIHNAGTGLALRAGVNDVALYDNSGTFRYVIESTRNRLQNTPSGLEYNGFRSGNYNGGGTGYSPTLLVGELQNTRLARSLGAQVQLSDGSHMYLEFANPVSGTDDNTLVHRTVSGVSTNILTATNQSSPRRGAQTYGMCRDSRDNVYVINQSDTFNALNCRVFTKSGSSWVAGTIRTGALPTYGGEINNVAVTWHPQGGTYGTLVAVVGHRASANNGTQMAYALINCDYLITGKGSLFRGSGDAENKLVALTSTDGFNNFANDTGTLLDISAATVGSDRGFVMSTARHQILGGSSGQSIARYTLNSAGTGFSENWWFHDTHSGYSLKDANAKSRVLPISDTQYVTVNASSSTAFGIVVKHRQQQADQFNVLSDVRLDAQGLTTMAAPSAYSAANNWDAVYNPLDHRVWVYYFDQANPNRLMRTHVDLNTGQAGRDQIEVASGVGVAGSENQAIRVHRHHTIGEQVLVSIANRTSGGTHTMIYVADTINVAPSQPTVLTKANFDADEASTFQWAFNDLNAGDTQSFARLQIDNATTEARVWDSWAGADAFGREVAAGGWGTADRGGNWSNNGGSTTDYSVTGGVGLHSHVTNNIYRITYLPDVQTADVDITATVTFPVVPTGDSHYAFVMARINATVDQFYFVRLSVSTAGEVAMSVRKRLPAETFLSVGSATYTHLAGQSYKVRFLVKGNVLRAKFWPTDQTEPAWQTEVTDTSLTAAGSVGLRSLLGGASTNAFPVVISWDDFTALAGSTDASYVLPAGSLTNEQDWRWRVMTWDRYGEQSPWSEYGFFTTSASGVVNITDPATDNDPDMVTANYLVMWEVTGTTQQAYRVVVTRTDNGTSLVDTGWVTSTATQYLVEGMLSDIEWQVAVTVRDAAAVESNTATRLITPNYNAPEVPIVTFDVADEDGYIQLNITNPEPVGDRPNPSVNEIHRRVYSATNPDGPYEVLGQTDPDGTLKDFTAASGVLYEYRVRAIAGEYFTDSTPTVADRELSLQGIWLHDPDDPAVTTRQFLYGKDNRSTAIDIKGVTQQFAGRVFPVTDFGEHEEEDLSVTVDIPHGPTHRIEEADLRAFAEMRRTLYLRDNRGRACYGTMSGYQQNDQAWGVTVGFKFGRVSLKIEEV